MAFSSASDTRIYVTPAHLHGFKGRAPGLNFLAHQPARSALAGRHGVRLRGRGLDFDEIRAYQPGDDVRRIDWRVTTRTGVPHVRIFVEERDRPALLVVDQRMSMFFGSCLNMKSVTAAEAAVLAAWRILDAGDRVGGIVFDDEGMVELRPKRNERVVNRLIMAICERNSRLHAERPAAAQPLPLATPLAAAARIAHHDHVVIVISDFDGIDESATTLIKRLGRHNDVVLMLVHDPMARNLPTDGRLVASDGALQASLDLRQPNVHAAVMAFTSGRLQRVIDWQDELSVPVLQLSAGEDTVTQLQRLLGVANQKRPIHAEFRK